MESRAPVGAVAEGELEGSWSRGAGGEGRDPARHRRCHRDDVLSQRQEVAVAVGRGPRAFSAVEPGPKLQPRSPSRRTRASSASRRAAFVRSAPSASAINANHAQKAEDVFVISGVV